MVLLLQYTLIFSSVLILVALGGCFAEHSGVINLGLEGIMVLGALGGALVMRYFGDSVSGAALVLLVLLGSVLFGVVYSTLLGVASINFKADQTLVGTAMNLLGTAGATVIVKAINTAANPDDVSSISRRGFSPHLPQGRQSLSHHSSAVRIPTAITRSATRLQMPHPAIASAMAVSPPASDERKVTFESSAKRNCRMKIVF